MCHEVISRIFLHPSKLPTVSIGSLSCLLEFFGFEMLASHCIPFLTRNRNITWRFWCFARTEVQSRRILFFSVHPRMLKDPQIIHPNQSMNMHTVETVHVYRYLLHFWFRRSKPEVTLRHLCMKKVS